MAGINDTFFCEGHLGNLPVRLRSPDPRYCRECCEFLLGEATKGGYLFSPKWVPRVSPSPPKPQQTHYNQNLAHKNQRNHPLYGAVVLKAGRPIKINKLQPRLL